MKKKGALFRIVKRDQGGPLRQAIAYIVAVALALFIGALLLRSQGVPFVKFYQTLFTMGMIGNRYPMNILEGFIRLFVPLIITSLALSLAFRMRFWNIGGEGQYIIGAICAAIAAFKLGNIFPQPVMILVIALCGFLGGGLYGLIAGVLKVKFGTNETLMTLMLNYIALYLLTFLGETKADWNFFLSEESVRPIFARFPEHAGMITIGMGSFDLNISLIFAAIICVFVYVYIKRSKQGYEIAVVGDSENTAKYAGIKVGRVVLRTAFISAALIGLAGALYVSSAGTLSTSVTNDVGWTGIVVAWLAKLNTVGIVITSVLITVLQYGCQAASTTFPSIDANFANLLQGVILFIVLAADFFIRFKIVIRSRDSQKEVSE